jgi:hypothetical protein
MTVRVSALDEQTEDHILSLVFGFLACSMFSVSMSFFYM